ncbi:MAG TPA: methyltransferase domain-containing protein [Solirubrobacterales bacterium]|nr:methyltransferase domain-containing protein [Solirubrobacterales bacterium]
MRDSAYRELHEVEDRHWWFKGRWAVVEALLSRTPLPESPRILDAGCGTGGNLPRYARIGSVEGAELFEEAVGLCHERGFDSVVQAGLESLPYEDGSFDLIGSTDVLEHVAAEQEALRELLRVAAPGGTLLLTVPAYMWMWTAEDDNLHHQRRYTRRRLWQAVEKAGWEPRVATYFNSLLLPPIAAVRLLSKGKKDGGGDEQGDLDRTPAWLDGPLSLPMRAEARLIRAGASLPAGVSVGIVCRKPE